MPSLASPGGWLSCLLLGGLFLAGLVSLWVARGDEPGQGWHLRLRATGEASLCLGAQSRAFAPIEGHVSRQRVALRWADPPGAGPRRWLSVRQPLADSHRAALGAWLVWLSRGSR